MNKEKEMKRDFYEAHLPFPQAPLQLFCQSLADRFMCTDHQRNYVHSFLVSVKTPYMTLLFRMGSQKARNKC